MAPTVLSALVASTCVLASGRRLAFAVSLTWLDPGLLVEAMQGKDSSDVFALGDAMGRCDAATWERDLVAAVNVRDEASRIALVNEQLHDVDWRAQRWARVPRVCASVASSAGFLFACMALTGGVALPTPDIGGTLISALDALAIGMAGASFCVAVHLRARRVIRERLAAVDRLVLCLEAALESPIVYPWTSSREPRRAARV